MRARRESAVGQGHDTVAAALASRTFPFADADVSFLSEIQARIAAVRRRRELVT
jgi:hypothetical protein